MHEIFLLLLVLLVGFIGSLVGTITAGAGLITFPGLLLLGIPPQIALGTSRFGSLGFRLGSLYNFVKHKKIIWNLTIPLTIIGVTGSIIGANMLVSLDEIFFSKLVGIILLILLPLIFLRKNVGTVQKEITKTKRRIAHLGYFLSKIWSGFFNPGSGFLTLFVMTNGYGLTILQSKGTIRIPSLFSDFAAFLIFLFAGLVDFKIGFALIIGTLTGSYIGSHIAIKKGDAWVKPLLVVMIVLISIKMIFYN